MLLRGCGERWGGGGEVGRRGRGGGEEGERWGGGGEEVGRRGRGGGEEGERRWGGGGRGGEKIIRRKCSKRRRQGTRVITHVRGGPEISLYQSSINFINQFP